MPSSWNPPSDPREPRSPGVVVRRHAPAGSARRTSRWLVGVVAAALLAVPGPARAQTLEDDLANTTSDLSTTRAEIDATTAELDEVRDRIVEIDESLATAEVRLAALDEELDALATEAEDLVDRMLVLQDDVVQARGRISQRARRLYMHGGTTPVLIMFEATTTDMAIDRANTVARVAETDRAQAEEAEAAERSLDLVVDELARKQGLIGVRSQEAAEVRDQVEDDLAEAERLRVGLSQRATELGSSAASLEAEVLAINDRIEAREAERRRREEEARRRREAEAERRREEAARIAAEQAAAEEAARVAAEQAAAEEAARVAAEQAAAEEAARVAADQAAAAEQAAADAREAERVEAARQAREAEREAAREAERAAEAARTAEREREREAARQAERDAEREAERAAEREREREQAEDRAPPPTSGGSRVCPMRSTHLWDDWGWPRGGGTRSHEGNDLYGDYREDVYAIVSGTWDVMPYGNSAGVWSILHGDDGNAYWYLHLDEHRVADGARVTRGQKVAWNGWTGNAVNTVYHIHFEYHPGGGGPADPHPMLSGIC